MTSGERRDWFLLSHTFYWISRILLPAVLLILMTTRAIGAGAQTTRLWIEWIKVTTTDGKGGSQRQDWTATQNMFDTSQECRQSGPKEGTLMLPSGVTASRYGDFTFYTHPNGTAIAVQRRCLPQGVVPSD